MNSNREDDKTVLAAAAWSAPDATDEKMTIAKRCSGGPSLNGADGAMCICYGCEKPVHWVKPFMRTVCGIKHDVQGHFRHNKRAGGCSGGEGLQHKAAKDAILTGTGWSFYVKCTGTHKQATFPDRGSVTSNFTIPCDREIRIDVPQQQKRAELPFQSYFLDVGVLDSSANVVGAVEVFHTNPMKRDKRDALTAAGVAWVEVRANEVLKVYNARGCGGRVQAVDCAAMQCDVCVLRQKEMDAFNREQRVLKEIELERLDRAKQKHTRAHRIDSNAEDARQAKSIIETQGPQALAESLHMKNSEPLRANTLNSKVDYSGVTFLDVPTPEDGKAPAKVDTDDESEGESEGESEDVTCSEDDVPIPATFWSEVITTTAQVLGMDLEQINVQKKADMARAVVAEQALLEASKAAGSNVLSFGKHRGTTVALLFDDEDTQAYVRWLAGFTGYKQSCYNRPEVHTDSSAYQFVPKAIAEEAKRLLKGRCLLCFCRTDQEWKSWCGAGCFREACR